MTIENQINSNEKQKSNNEAGKANPEKEFIDLWIKLEKIKIEITKLENQLPTQNKQEAQLLKKVCEKIRQNNLDAARDASDLFNDDGSNVELNVKYLPFDKDVLTLAEIKLLGYDNANAVSKILQKHNNVIKKWVEDEGYMEKLLLDVSKINVLKDQELSLRSNLFALSSEAEKHISNEIWKLSHAQKVTKLQELCRESVFHKRQGESLIETVSNDKSFGIFKETINDWLRKNPMNQSDYSKLANSFTGELNSIIFKEYSSENKIQAIKIKQLLYHLAAGW